MLSLKPIEKVIRLERFAIQNVATLVLLGCLTLTGCYQTLPTSWEKDITGKYEGGRAEFREVVEFKPGGIFCHEVFIDGKSVLNEASRWSVESGRFAINVDSFTQFYDPSTRNCSASGSPFVGYVFLPLPEGKTFSKISASVDFDFCLYRQK
jgi:hypothetical protein